MSHHPDPQTPQTSFPDPTSTLLNASCLDLLLIELVPMAYRLTAELQAREDEWIHGASSTSRPVSGTEVKGAGTGTEAGSISAGGGGGSGAGGIGTAGGMSTVDEEEAREAVFYRLELLGYRVGLGVVERFSRDKPRPTTPLDIIKFLCKDLWTLLFRKQIDNLKTNHRGIYVLTDNTFKPLNRMSFDTRKPHTPYTASIQGGGGRREGDEAVEGVVNAQIARAQPFLYFPAGVIRGCLAALGIQATVQAETSALPGATFQIRTLGAKA